MKPKCRCDQFHSLQEWGKIRDIAAYLGVSEKTARAYLKMGLPHSRLPNGTILVKFSHADAWVDGFRETPSKSQVDNLVNGTLAELGFH